MKFIPYGKQHISNQDINSVKITLKKKIITTGQTVLNFEKKISKYLNCKYISACNSGTSALFLALLSIDLKKNDKIIMPSVNFISSYNICKTLGAKIYLADVDEYSGQMTPNTLNQCIKKYKLKKVKAIIPMYNGGHPINADKFLYFKKKLNCYIIEDACHALGSSYLYKKNFVKVGSCKHSDISTFSFHPLKTITTGEGGLVTTNNSKLDEKIKMFRSLGIKRKFNTHWKYDVILEGFNFRLNDFQSALGISQLSQINKFLKKRENIVSFYNKNLSEIPRIRTPEINSNYKSSNHLYIIILKDFNQNKKDKFIEYMKKNKVMVQYHYIPIYKFSIFKKNINLKQAEKYFNSAISLPIFYDLKLNEQKYIVNLIKKYFKIYK